MALIQIKHVADCRGSVGRIQGTVAIRVLRIDAGRTGGTTLRVGLAEHHWQVGELRKRRYNRKSFVHVAQVIRQPHADPAIHDLGRALCMKADEVEWGAVFSRREILAARTVLEKLFQKGCGGS